MSTAILWFSIGCGGGWMSVVSLRWNVDHWMREGARHVALAVYGLRLLLIAVCLGLAARQGAVPLLLAATGALATRAVLLRRFARGLQ